MAQNRAAGLNLKVLEDREVLFATIDNPVIDIATGTFLEGWHSGGLEPSGSTWSENREVASNTTNLTGGQTATSYTAGAVTSTVDLIPGSPVLDWIEWPTSSVVDGVVIREHSSRVAKAYVARVHKYADDIVHIRVSREKAALTVADRSTTTDPTARTVNIAYNNGDGEQMFEDMYYHVDGDTVTQVTPRIFQSVADVQDQIDAGTAFIPDASAGSLTAFVPTETVSGDAELIEFTEPEAPVNP